MSLVHQQTLEVFHVSAKGDGLRAKVGDFVEDSVNFLLRFRFPFPLLSFFLTSLSFPVRFLAGSVPACRSWNLEGLSSPSLQAREEIETLGPTCENEMYFGSRSHFHVKW